MVDKQYGSYYAICDACGTALEAEYDEFQDAVDGMKANGWRTSKIGGEWVNYCPECAGKLLPKRPGAGEFAGVGSDTCGCGACGRRIPDDDTETRRKIALYRQKHGLG